MTKLTPEVEIDLPFRVDGSGRIAFTSDLAVQTRNHVMSVAGTNVGERVMRPVYGTDIIEHVFGTLDAASEDEISQNITEALLANCPEATIAGIDMDPDVVNGTLNITIRFLLANDVEQTATIVTQLPSA